MIDTAKIESEIKRAEQEHEKLLQNIKDTEHDQQKELLVKKAAESDVRKAQENVDKLKAELERVTRDKNSEIQRAQSALEKEKSDQETVHRHLSEVETKLREYKQREGDYKSKIDGLHRQMEQLAKSLESKK